MLCCNLCFATSFDEDLVTNYSNVATGSVLSTSSNIATISTVSSTDSKSDVNNNTSRKSGGGGSGGGNHTSQNTIDTTKKNDRLNISVDANINVDNNIDSNSTKISGKSTLEELREISGYTEEEIYNEIASDEAFGNMLSDLMNELRPYLKDVIDIDVNVNGYYAFSSKEALSLIVKHPIKFLMAIYNYTIQSMKEIFNIAEENATVVTE